MKIWTKMGYKQTKNYKFETDKEYSYHLTCNLSSVDKNIIIDKYISI